MGLIKYYETAVLGNWSTAICCDKVPVRILYKDKEHFMCSCEVAKEISEANEGFITLVLPEASRHKTVRSKQYEPAKAQPRNEVEKIFDSLC